MEFFSPCSQVGLQVAPLTHIHPAVMLTGGREAETLRVCVAGCVWFQDGSGTWVGHLTLQFCGILELRRGSQPSPWVGPGKPNLPLGLRGKAGGGARDAGRAWGQEEKGTTEDEMAGWHH